VPDGVQLRPTLPFEQFSERISEEIYNFIRNSG
jgi:hypothetical protein